MKKKTSTGGDKKTVNVTVADRVEAVSVENRTSVSLLAFNLSDYHPVDLIVRIKQIMNLDIALRDISLSHVKF